MTHVLIVDDKAENLYYLHALLTGHGCTVESAHHGAEALVKARQSPPDLIISDLLMPVMDGYTLLRYWKADARLKQIPFIVYTATYTEEEDERLALNLGADAFILKPAEPDDFLARIYEVQRNAASALPLPPRRADGDENAQLKLYSETLIRKLEEKSLQLEEANQTLRQDIGERKQTEAALRASENELRTLIEAMPQIVWIARPDGWHIHFNRGWTEYTGLSLEESLGHGWNPPFHPDDRPRAAELWTQATQNEQPYEIEYRLRRADGEYRWMLGRALPLRDDNGKIAKWFGTCTDIQDLKQAEEIAQTSEREQRELAAQLAEERARLISAQSVAKVGSWETDLATLDVLWSDETYRIFETDAAHFAHTHESFLQFTHPDDYVMVDEAFRASFSNCEPNVLEHRILMPDGRVKFVEEHWQVFCCEQNKPLRAIGTCQDITARRQAESQRDRFFTLSLDLLGVASMDGYFKRVNPAFMEILGLSEAEMTAIPFLDFVHPEDKAATLEVVKSLAEGHPVVSFENRYRTKDNSWRWLEWRSVAVLDEGMIYAAARDITERREAEEELRRMRDQLEVRVQKRTRELEQANAALREEELQQKQVMDALAQSEERFRLLVERVHDYAILMLDTSGHILTWNAGAEYLNQYRAEEIIGRHFSYLHNEEDQRAGEPGRVLRAAVKHGHAETEGWRVRKDGSRYWATVVITALRDDDGNLRGFAKITRDITERRNIEAALREAKKQADAANQAKSEFLSRMSHELRTPLNAILGFGQLLAKQDFAPTQLERVDYILKAGRHLLDLINEVLDISRIEAGRITLSIEPVLVSDTVQEVISLVRPLATEYSIQLQESECMELETFILADRQRVKQVLLNLCSNAIKYNSPQGKVSITCETMSNNQLRIKVSDTGIGITDSAQENLFIPFMRLGAEQSGIEGTGLGLALSLNLVHAMGGTMGVESTVDIGSTFWFQLPLTTSPALNISKDVKNKSGEILAQRKLSSQNSLAQNFPSQAPGGSTHAGGADKDSEGQTHEQFTILYIEDNLSNLQLIEAIIDGMENYQLISAMQGRMGLDLARQHHPDLILLDLHLPDMPGDQVLARLQADSQTSGIPVVMLSAVAAQSEIKRLLFAGARAYLTKPLDIGQFLDTLANILQSPKRQL